MKDWRYNLNIVLAHKDLVRTRVPFLLNRMIRKSHERSIEAARRLKDKEVIEVAFFLTIPGMWKADYLFKQMQVDPHYHPYVVIYPYSKYKGFSKDEVFSTIKRTEEFVKGKGFEYVIPFDEQRNEWQDVKKTLNPDIVFFTTPYRDVDPKYYVYHWMDRLTCYISYSFVSLNLYALHYRTLAVNLYGLCFEETEMHREFACEHGMNKGLNAIATGYPGTEVYLRDDYESRDVWKPQSHRKKRIIWAPHHTIDDSDGFSVSTFLTYADTMLELAEKYKDSVQIAFKPHQLLKFKLIKLWGKEKADAYYQRWADGENTQLEESGYVDLFIHSDAMVHDSGSFTTEYMFLKKPVMFLVKEADAAKEFNRFGLKAFENHYHGRSVSDIESFVQDVVLDGKDSMQAKREEFFNQYLSPKDGVLPSQKIIEIIEKTIREA